MGMSHLNAIQLQVQICLKEGCFTFFCSSAWGLRLANSSAVGETHDQWNSHGVETCAVLSPLCSYLLLMLSQESLGTSPSCQNLNLFQTIAFMMIMMNDKGISVKTKNLESARWQTWLTSGRPGFSALPIRLSPPRIHHRAIWKPGDHSTWKVVSMTWFA